MLLVGGRDVTHSELSRQPLLLSWDYRFMRHVARPQLSIHNIVPTRTGFQAGGRLCT